MSSRFAFHSGRRRFVASLASKNRDLTASLIHRGYSDANIQAVFGGNFRRLLGSTWTATREQVRG
jgi:microsomal dipeptidase-like Zn-dependent dipeptidase